MASPSRARTIMSAQDVSRSLTRIAHEIIERNKGESVLLLGIQSRGVPLATRLGDLISSALDASAVEVGSIDITMYRDDLATQPTRAPKESSLPNSGIDGMRVVLVDDVFYTGRTIRAALEALSDYGRPACVQLAVLVDRGHRELPIRADFVGKNIPTSTSERVTVRLEEFDGTDEVLVEEGA